MGVIASTGNFLLPTPTIIPEAIVFFILLGVLAKWVIPPIDRTLEARRAQIAESLEVIEQARSAEESSRARAQAILAEAREQARLQLEQAARIGDELREEQRQRGQEEYERLVARAQTDIDRASQRATEELRRRFSELVVATAEQVIERELDAQAHRTLIDEAIGEVESRA